MRLADLHLEIQIDILRLCSLKDLAVLSRVNTSLQHVAEHVLYSRIDIKAEPTEMASLILSQDGPGYPLALKEDRSLLHTLAACPRKASIVKTFYIELETTGLYEVHTKALQLVLIKVAEALGKMSNLIDFRIIHLPVGDLSEGGISQVIRGGYFKPHTLFLEYYHDLEGIIDNNPHLQLLGIHYVGPEDSSTRLWTKIKALYRNPSRRRTMPLVFMLNCSLDESAITLIPSFYCPGKVLRACQEILKSRRQWPTDVSCYWTRYYKLSFCLLGISSENIDLLSETMEAIMACVKDGSLRASHVVHLTFTIHENFIQKPWRFPQFVKRLVLFDEFVPDLCFYFLDLGDRMLEQFSTDLESCLLKGLGQPCPILGTIMLSCHQTERSLTWSQRLGSANWSVTEEFWHGMEWIDALENDEDEVDGEDDNMGP